MKAVLDCNVFLSALIRPGGPPALILTAMLRQEFELVLSPAIFSEYQRTINYPRIRKRILLSAQELRELEDDILVLAFWVESITLAHPLVVADPSDDAYLLAAAEGEADYVVSGDHHLLAFRKYEGIQIIPPRVFLQTLR